MQRLIDHLLRQAQLENVPEIVRQPVALLPLVESLCASRIVQAQGKHLQIDRDSLQGLNVAADRLLLEQALANLLDNALDFTAAGGSVTFSGGQDADEIWLQVSDNGSGIPDYAIGHIFERFYSLPRGDGEKSSGLGLAFVREVARLHQGSIALTNRPQGGVSALLTLKNSR